MPDGSPGTQPVRSQEFLLGLPDLSEIDQIKVDAANRLYDRMGKFLIFLDEKGVAWDVENPTNSFLWDLDY
jgi:inhibitor of KinA sporulation pathway (predicted exonuclease)